MTNFIENFSYNTYIYISSVKLESEGHNPITALTELQEDDEKMGIASATKARFYTCPSSSSFSSTPLFTPPFSATNNCKVG